MIKKLLRPAREVGPHSRTFVLYVVASCYEKMLTRMDYRISLSIRMALKNLLTFNYSEQLYNDRPSEIDADASFLSALLSYAPSLKLKTNFPNLARKATTPHLALPLYTRETCMEFHLLLSELLERFFNELLMLKKLRGHETDTKKILSTLMSIAIVGSLVRPMIKGTALKKHLKVIEDFLPKGQALTRKAQEDDDEYDDMELYVSDPEALMQVPLPKWQLWCNVLQLMVIHFDSAQILVGFLGRFRPDVDFDIQVLSQPLPDHTLVTWQKLLLDIGPHFITIPRTHEIIKFLDSTVEPGEQDFLEGATAKTVLRSLAALGNIPEGDPNFATAIDEISSQIKMLANDPSPASALILDNLQSLRYTKRDNLIKAITKIANHIKKITAEVVLQSLKALGEIPQEDAKIIDFTAAVNDIIFQVKMLANCTSPLSGMYLPTIIAKLKSLRDMWIYITQDDTIKEIAKVAEIIRTLRDNAKIHRALEVGEPLHSGKNCQASCHCEAGLAAYCCLHPEWGKFVSPLFPHRTHPDAVYNTEW